MNYYDINEDKLFFNTEENSIKHFMDIEETYRDSLDSYDLADEILSNHAESYIRDILISLFGGEKDITTVKEEVARACAASYMETVVDGDDEMYYPIDTISERALAEIEDIDNAEEPAETAEEAED